MKRLMAENVNKRTKEEKKSKDRNRKIMFRIEYFFSGLKKDINPLFFLL